MANPKHVELVMQGRWVINEWRRKHPDAWLDLNGADLSGSNLSWADLNRAGLVDANLRGADLSGTDFGGADLTNANLRSANLAKAYLRNARLRCADLGEANLSWADLELAVADEVNLDKADLREARLMGASLNNAILRKAVATEADFQGARLLWADLREADLGQANLRGASLFGARLGGADFREASGLRLNGQDIRGARFSPRAKDPWSVVRRNYTGPLLLFHLAFLGCFVAPYLFRALKWAAASAVQKHVESVPLFAGEPWPIWQLLLGWDKGRIYAATGAALVAYNVLRAVLTWWLSQVRDAEERSGFAPDWDSYKWCYWAHHHFMRYVFWFAIASFLWHVLPWLGETVIKPA